MLKHGTEPQDDCLTTSHVVRDSSEVEHALSRRLHSNIGTGVLSWCLRRSLFSFMGWSIQDEAKNYSLIRDLLTVIIVLCPKLGEFLPLISAKYAAPTPHRERKKRQLKKT